MNCNEAKTKIEAYVDKELTLSDQRDVEAHINACSDCKLVFEHLVQMGAAIRRVGRTPVPTSLRKNISTNLRQSYGNRTTLEWAPFVIAGFTGACVALVIFFMGSLLVQTETTHSPIQEQLVTAHISSLLVDHLTDVRSSDKHTVKPWFSGKIGYAPKVNDLSADGYELIGGRLDYVMQSPVAALVYKRRSHIINLFTRVSHKDQLASHAMLQSQYNGYHVVRWNIDGLEYWAVSDLNPVELLEFSYQFSQ